MILYYRERKVVQNWTNDRFSLGDEQSMSREQNPGNRERMKQMRDWFVFFQCQKPKARSWECETTRLNTELEPQPSQYYKMHSSSMENLILSKGELMNFFQKNTEDMEIHIIKSGSSSAELPWDLNSMSILHNDLGMLLLKLSTKPVSYATSSQVYLILSLKNKICSRVSELLPSHVNGFCGFPVDDHDHHHHPRLRPSFLPLFNVIL